MSEMNLKKLDLLTVLADHLLKTNNDMTYGDFKDLAKRTASYQVLIDKVFNI